MHEHSCQEEQRNIGQEHRAPAEMSNQRRADLGTDRGGQRHHRTKGTEGATTHFGGQFAAQKRHGARYDDRAGCSHDHARAGHEPQLWRDISQQGADCEEQLADTERSPMPNPVAGFAAHTLQHDARQQVARDQPGQQRIRIDRERSAHLGQRDGDHRGVERSERRRERHRRDQGTRATAGIAHRGCRDRISHA